jgi:hypothetical protein
LFGKLDTQAEWALTELLATHYYVVSARVGVYTSLYLFQARRSATRKGSKSLILWKLRMVGALGLEPRTR